MQVPTKVALPGFIGLIYAFMYLPVLVVLIFSFNNSEVFAFPLQGFTLQWYLDVLSDARLAKGFGITMMVALPVSILSTLMGALAALALTRFATSFRRFFLVLLLIPFLIPKAILAMAQLILLSELGVERSLITVITAQTVIILPFASLIIASVLIRIDPRLEEAAADLGASRFSAFRRVTMPLMKNGMMAAFFIAFVLSTSEFVLTSFVSGREQPLSVLVASDFRFNIAPTLDALAILIVVGNLALVAIGELIRLRDKY
ncbi:ABC transporter permease [Rhodobacteraceae bacterium F11138]|nr:ABC transporter permease [Rhodobacteraceae bacterium F11138]